MPDHNSPEFLAGEATARTWGGWPRAFEQRTRAYKSTEFLAGQEAGFKEGIAVTVAALKIELIRAGCTEDEVGNIIGRVSAGATTRP